MELTTSTILNDSTSPTPLNAADGIQSATSVLAFHVTGVVSIFGVIGNALSVLVLQRANRHRRCPLFSILSALCLIDAVFILGNFVINVLSLFYEYYQIQNILVYFLYVSRGYTVKYLMPVCFTMQLASIYITLLVSYERFQAVCRPLSVANCKPAGRAVYRNICLVLLLSGAYNVPKFFELTIIAFPLGDDVFPEAKREALVANSHRLFGCYHSRPASGANGSSCEIQAHSYQLAAWMRRSGNETAGVTGVYEMVYAGALYSLFYFLIPVSAITYMNIRIARSLRRSINMWQVTRRQEKEAQLTYVSLAIVISFYLFMLPNVLLTIIETVARPSERHQQRMQLLIVATNFLVLINSCLNFILYCVIGKKFRQSLRDLLCWPCDRWCHRGGASDRRRADRGNSSVGLPTRPSGSSQPAAAAASAAAAAGKKSRRSRQRQERRCSSCAEVEDEGGQGCELISPAAAAEALGSARATRRQQLQRLAAAGSDAESD